MGAAKWLPFLFMENVSTFVNCIFCKKENTYEKAVVYFSGNVLLGTTLCAAMG